MIRNLRRLVRDIRHGHDDLTALMDATAGTYGEYTDHLLHDLTDAGIAALIERTEG